MPRTALTPKEVPRIQDVSVTANETDYTYAVGDVANGNSVPWTGKEILLVNNINGGPQTITIDAAPDSYGRDGAITTYSVGAAEFAVFNLSNSIWRQTDGSIYINCAHADVKLAVLTVKNIA